MTYGVAITIIVIIMQISSFFSNSNVPLEKYTHAVKRIESKVQAKAFPGLNGAVRHQYVIVLSKIIKSIVIAYLIPNNNINVITWRSSFFSYLEITISLHSFKIPDNISNPLNTEW